MKERLTVKLRKYPTRELNRLRELEDDIEEGRIIELPKKCYLITKDDYLIHKCDIYEIKFSGISGKPTRIRAKTPFGNENFNYRDIGTIVFLSEAEAEKKIEELKKV